MTSELPAIDPAAGAQAAFRYLESALSSLPPANPAGGAPRRRPPPVRGYPAAGPGAELRVAVVHDSPIVAAGLAATFAALPEVQAVDLVPADRWTALLEPAAPPRLVFAGYQAAVALARACREDDDLPMAVACVTGRDQEVEIRSAMGAGVAGYLLDECGLEDYAECVRRLGGGGQYVCVRARQRLAESQHLRSLTPRELNVLRLVIDGRSNQAIGEELDLALGTIKAHVRAILTKLGARSRTQAASLAAGRGLYAAAA